MSFLKDLKTQAILISVTPFNRGKGRFICMQREKSCGGLFGMLV